MFLPCNRPAQLCCTFSCDRRCPPRPPEPPITVHFRRVGAALHFPTFPSFSMSTRARRWTFCRWPWTPRKRSSGSQNRIIQNQNSCYKKEPEDRALRGRLYRSLFRLHHLGEILPAYTPPPGPLRPPRLLRGNCRRHRRMGAAARRDRTGVL